MIRRHNIYLAALGLLTLVAFGVRAAPLDAQSLWRDEVDALCYAFEFPHLILHVIAPEAAGDLRTPCACPPSPVGLYPASDGRVLRRLIQALGGMIRQNGPLYFVLLRGWIALTGTSAYGMRFFSLLFGVLSVPLTYTLGRQWFDRRVGLLAALLMTGSPYLTWYAQETKMYSLVLALALVALYSLRRALEGGGIRWWTVQVVATSLAFYSHVLAALLVPVQILLALTWWPQARRRWIGASVSLACLTLPYLPLLLWQAPQVFRVRETGFYPYGLGQMVEILFTGWSLGVTSQGWPWGALLMAALITWGLAGRWLLPPTQSRSGESREYVAVTTWLVAPLLGVWLISLRQPLFTDRYLIWSAPAFYLLVAVGLAPIWRWGEVGRWATVLVVSILFAFNTINLWHQATTPIKSDFRAAAAHVAAHYSPDELILFQIPHGRYTFDYYFPTALSYHWREGLYTNYRAPDGSYLTDEARIAHDLETATAEYRAVWLVATETAMWDERGLVQAWLADGGELAHEAHFTRVDVYQYVK